jgi:hypothetical protein
VLNAQQKVTGSSTIDFNVKFATDLLADPKQTFYAKLENVMGQPKLIIASADIASDPELLAAGDFKRSALRNRVSDKGQTTAPPGIPLTAKSLRAGNWIANGRYTIGNETADRDGNRVFDISYHSTAHTKSDKLHLNQPAFTLGTAREVDEAGSKQDNKQVDIKASMLLKRARAAHPLAQSDAEALAMYFLDKEESDVDRLDQVNDREDRMIDRLDQVEQDLQRQINKLQGHEKLGMAEGSWGGSGPGGLLDHYAVYTKQNGQVKRIKSTNKFDRPMNPREAEAYVAAMRKRDPARWTHDTVWHAPADHDLDEAVNEKGALKAAQQAAEFIITNLDDRAALKDYSLHFWSPAKFYQGATRAMRGAGVDEIAKHIIQDRPAEFPKNQNEAANPAQQAAIAIAMKRAGKVKEQGVYIGKSLTSVKILEYIKTVLENFIRTKGFKGGPSLVNELRPLLDQLDQVNEKDLAMNIREMMQAAERNDRSTRGLSWGMFAQELSKKIPELIRKRTTQGVTEAIPVIRGTQSTGAQYANQLAKIAMKLAKQRHADGLRADAKDFNKAAKLFAAGDVDGGAEIIAYEMDTEPADEFYAYMEHYKIPTEIVFGLNEETTRLDPKCWTGKKIGNPKTKVKGGVRVNNCVPAEESYTGVMESQGITDPKFLEVARRIDAFAKTIK